MSSLGGGSFSPSEEMIPSGGSGSVPSHSASASSNMASADIINNSSAVVPSSGYSSGRHSLPDMMSPSGAGSSTAPGSGAAPRKSALKVSGGYRFNSSSITLRHMPPPEFADSPTPSCSDYILQQQQDRLNHHHGAGGSGGGGHPQSTLPRLSSSSYRHPPQGSSSSGGGGGVGPASTGLPHHSSNSSSSSNSHYCNGGSSTLPLKSSLKKPLSLLPPPSGAGAAPPSSGAPGTSGPAGPTPQAQTQDNSNSWETHSRSSMEELRV